MIPEPNRAAGLARLAEFAPRMGRHYAGGRNADPGPGRHCDVSMLSGHLRHRLITESEAVGTALAAHGPRGAEKFIQEVFWRSYWKGFLELRPSMWPAYRSRAARNYADRDAGAYARAVQGETGIACFDAWVHELVETGWLHNHARMWFASIWIFTLRLPWVLGAEFFLHHLVDADAASNTLSWRWVGGIQTMGKHYLARAENIARYTGGRFDPRGALDEDAAPLAEQGPPPAVLLPPPDAIPQGRVALLLHADDLHIEGLPEFDVAAIAGICLPEQRSVTGCGAVARRFTEAALADAMARAEQRFGAPARRVAPDEIAGWAAGLPIVTPHAPVGWVADALAGIPLHRFRRPWDAACWPLAQKGFFPFREAIPRLIGELRPTSP